MKTVVYSISGESKGEIDLPEVFSNEIREDILRKAFRIISLSYRHPYGSSPLAGMRRVGHTSRPGMGISRMPRVSGSSRAVELGSTKGGRSPHSPRSSKNLVLHINKKEKAIAWRTAVAMTAMPEIVKKRGHQFSDELKFPVVVDDGINKINKAKDAKEFLENLGVWEDVERAKEKTKIRAGRGKMRNRRYRTPKSILIVTSSPSSLKAFKSLPGVDIAHARNISISKLAPGGQGGRLVIYTEASIKEMEGEQ
ncbi:MAG: 50S ribosomal protein L4 [Candidatus Thermoplasmatota archaeon]|jgi:large subunit ribosomal protein L4e|nr:50S ribosomal protein L4 [Candidatus Thermoplasmatota archaeon]MCL5790605.1 50S ribosomal protein L4 [Candidatus Thermoplasmatota archaeon]